MSKFKRFISLIGESSFFNLENKTILVLGVGGVGGYVVESLVRSGIKNIIIVDSEKIDESNINRQIIALNSTINQYKVDVIEKRILDINEEVNVIKIKEFIDESNYNKLFERDIDYFVDACDTVKTKKLVIKKCLMEDIPIISSMGTGNKLDPTRFKIISVNDTSYDPLARIIRKYLKKENINKKLMVVSSDEKIIKTNDDFIKSCSFVPSVAGLLITSYIIKDLINKKNT